MTTSAASSSSRTRALVLGGGGVAGIAWEAGVLLGLREAGVDVAGADFVMGTSAGATVAVALRAGRLDDLRPTSGGDAAPTPDSSASSEQGTFDGMRFATLMGQMARGTGGAQEARARLGQYAIEHPVSMSEDAWVARLGSRLPTSWPAGRLGITAVDATGGAFRVFESTDGVELARAVAASSTVPTVFPLVTIEGRPWMDGGMRSATNADAAEGHDVVVVLACSPEPPTSPFGPTLPQAVRDLEASAQVLVIEADDASRRAFGTNVLDFATEQPSFDAGLAQGRRVAEQVAQVWGA